MHILSTVSYDTMLHSLYICFLNETYIAMSIAQKPIIQSINNDVATSVGAMPNKSIYSVNENRFSMGRHLYSKTVATLTKETVEVKREKQYYGQRNRDASSVMQRKKYLAQGRKNYAEKPVSFQGNTSVEDINRALARARRA